VKKGSTSFDAGMASHAVCFTRLAIFAMVARLTNEDKRCAVIIACQWPPPSLSLRTMGKQAGKGAIRAPSV
jgi:hypothetical protein